MAGGASGRARTTLFRVATAATILAVLAVAATSPQLAWRHSTYIIAGFAGIVALALLLIQPLLIGGFLGMAPPQARRAHRWVGSLLVAAVLVHVGGLWITSPPDVIDALLFDSPTPFSPFGVVAMWAVFIVALLAALRRRVDLRPKVWRRLHLGLALIIAAAAIGHTLLIEGTMEPWSKALLCALVGVAIAGVVWARRSTW